MISECPSCRTQFNVTAEQLALADGDVRCGKCMLVFSALKTQVVEQPTETRLSISPLSDPEKPADTDIAQNPKSTAASDEESPTTSAKDEKIVTREWLEQLLPNANSAAQSSQSEVAESDDKTLSKTTIIEKFAANGAVDEQTTAHLADTKNDANTDNIDLSAERIEPQIGSNEADIDLTQLDTIPIAIDRGKKFRQGESRYLSAGPKYSRLIRLATVVVLLALGHFFVSTYTQWIPEHSPMHVKRTWQHPQALTPSKITAAAVNTFESMRCRLQSCPDRVAHNPYVLNQLLIRNQSEQDQLLLIEAVIMHNANRSLPFPDLELTFANLDGDVSSTLRFGPSDYLKGEASEMTAMPGQTPFHIAVSTPDLGANAVNYSARIVPTTNAKRQ